MERACALLDATRPVGNRPAIRFSFDVLESAWVDVLLPPVWTVDVKGPRDVRLGVALE